MALPIVMSAVCKHAFADTAAVFTGAVQIRACRKCGRIEVMPVANGSWMCIDEYVRLRVSNRLAGG